MLLAQGRETASSRAARKLLEPAKALPDSPVAEIVQCGEPLSAFPTKLRQAKRLRVPDVRITRITWHLQADRD